jgi:hypothetical protein
VRDRQPATPRPLTPTMTTNPLATISNVEDQLPQLRAWTEAEAEQGRAMSDVAAELSARWGVSPIPLRKLIMEAFSVGLRTANAACGHTGSGPEAHPQSALANAQLNESWMRDMAVSGTQVVLDFHDVRGCNLSMTQGTRTWSHLRPFSARQGRHPTRPTRICRAFGPKAPLFGHRRRRTADV